MKQQTPIRAYFESVRQAERALWLIRQQQRHAMDVATRLSGAGSDTHIRSPNARSSVEMAAVRMADLDSALNAQSEEYVRLIEEARGIIQQIPQPRFREVLTLRYLCGYSWRTIADEMAYDDPKSVFRVHGYALEIAGKIKKF